MEKKYTLVETKIGDEIFFELENENNIFKGIVVEGFINIFEPKESKYFIDNVEPILKKGDIIDLIGVPEVREIGETKKINKIKIKAENFAHLNETKIEIINGILQIHYVYLSDLKIFELENKIEKKDYLNLRKNVNKKIINLNELSFSEKRNEIQFDISKLYDILEPEEKVYFFKKHEIEKGTIKKIYVNLSNLIIPHRDNLLKYKVLLNNEKELIFYIEDENEELFITKKIYKSKAELVKLISKLPKLK